MSKLEDMKKKNRLIK